MLSHNIEETLTDLCYHSLRLAKNNIRYTNNFIDIKMIEPKDYQRSIYTKQQLDQIEEKCMETFKKVKEERKKLDTCVICWSQQAKAVLMPCMHLVVCKECSQVYQCKKSNYGIRQATQNIKKECPLCKNKVESVALVYR